eukprot:scaffold99418_cov54-Phaeocystis_antarctica.AAC.1
MRTQEKTVVALLPKGEVDTLVQWTSAAGLYRGGEEGRRGEGAGSRRTALGPLVLFDSPAAEVHCVVFAATGLRLVCGCDTDLQRTTPFCSLGGGDYSDCLGKQWDANELN